MNRQLKAVLVGFIATLLVITGLVLLVWLVVLPRVRDISLPGLDRIGTSRQIVDFHTHFNLDPTIPQSILDGQRIRYMPPPRVEYRGGTFNVYLRLDFLREHIDPFMFWDAGAEVLFVSTRYEMLEFTPDSYRFLINEGSHLLDTPIRRANEMVYVPADLLHQLYPLTIEFFEEYNMVVITSADKQQTVATVAVSRADVRYWAGGRAPITAQPTQGTQLLLFPSDDDGEFVRVRTPLGLLGYVLRSDLENITTGYPRLNRAPVLDDWIDNWQPHPPNWPEGVAINMVWEMIYFVEAHPHRMQHPLHPGLTVISPQWFRINPEGTHLDSVASREFVDWAHEQNTLVWPLVFDVNNDRAREFLFNREHRRYAINQLLRYADILNFDGINIDFEHLTASQGPYKIQFLRELAIPARERGLVLSAAVKIPLPDTTFYRRDLIALTLDFVQVMTYDEHWGPAAGVGPNASLPWVQWGVNNTLNGIYPERGVPASQLIMGLPFYNRKWRVVQSDGSITQRALPMAYTRQFFENRNVDWVWDPNYGSYFGEVGDIEDGEAVFYRVWLECPRSIRAKMQIVLAHDLAGVASWSRGFEVPEVWDVISHYLS